MAYLTDKEKRLLFSALSREKEVCKQLDKECCREPYEETLESVVKSLERKFYYDRFEKEIRNKVIDEFVSELENHSIFADTGKGKEVKMEWASPVTRIKEVAEQLKKEGV